MSDGTRRDFGCEAAWRGGLARGLRQGAWILLALALGSTGCVGAPSGVTPVDGFEADRYLGTWYEIARLDHRFERGLSNVRAVYTARDDGGIGVLNRGYDAEAGEWSEAEGKAYFVAERTKGMLAVSFFGPFYGGYNVIALDEEDYAWSMVAGPDRSYLWILSRRVPLEPAILERLIAEAARLGFPTDELIFVEHDPLPSAAIP